MRDVAVGILVALEPAIGVDLQHPAPHELCRVGCEA